MHTAVHTSMLLDVAAACSLACPHRPHNQSLPSHNFPPPASLCLPRFSAPSTSPHQCPPLRGQCPPCDANVPLAMPMSPLRCQCPPCEANVPLAMPMSPLRGQCPPCEADATSLTCTSLHQPPQAYTRNKKPRHFKCSYLLSVGSRVANQLLVRRRTKYRVRLVPFSTGGEDKTYLTICPLPYRSLFCRLGSAGGNTRHRCTLFLPMLQQGALERTSALIVAAAAAVDLVVRNAQK
ncbi:unnamed protein product [Ectocarpus sp. 6 AP-2014]